MATCQAQAVESPLEPTREAAPTSTQSPITPTRNFPNTHTPPPTPPEATNAPAAPETERFAQHVVQAGDTLLGIAMAYDLPMAAIQIQNDMGSSTVVQVGQTLSIPPRAAWDGASPFWIVHVVEEGETVVDIAATYGLQASAVEAANGLPDANMIVVGQELVLPLRTLAVAEVPPPTPTPLPSLVLTLTPTPEFASAPVTATAEIIPTDQPAFTTTPVPTTPPVAPAAPPADIADWPMEVFRLINEVRAQHGLPALAYNETLANVAQAHANDCLQRGWGSHYGSDGSTVKTRMERAGYNPLRWSECWAHMQSPQQAIDFWMDEVPPNDPHRRTLLSTWLTEVGVGVVDPDWGYYFFANFGQPRE